MRPSCARQGRIALTIADNAGAGQFFVTIAVAVNIVVIVTMTVAIFIGFPCDNRGLMEIVRLWRRIGMRPLKTNRSPGIATGDFAMLQRVQQINHRNQQANTKNRCTNVRTQRARFDTLVHRSGSGAAYRCSQE